MADFACGTGGFITSWLKELEPQIQTTEDRKSFSQSIYGIEKKQFPYMLAITNLLLHEIDEPRIFHDNSLAYNVLDYTEKDSFDKILMIISSIISSGIRSKQGKPFFSSQLYLAKAA